MANHVELRDPEQARLFLLEGAQLQRVAPPTASSLRNSLEWALEAASAGQPLPPLGFIADLGLVAFGLDQGMRGARDSLGGAGLPAGLARSYEDHVLGKLYADWNFERASDALRRYQGRDRARGLAFVLGQFRERAGFPGVYLSPGVIRGILETPLDDALVRGGETLLRDGLMPILPELYEALIAAARRLADVLGPEDIFELEHGTALAELGQRVALRQVLQATERLEATLPPHRVRPLAGRQVVPTRVLDEDTYPVGGYSSLSTRGSIESLLYSQLAYMEKDNRPDLFDIKFLRDELLYYSRDENQFLRRRRTFVFALAPDLPRTRFKDAELPWQRIVLLLGLMTAVVRKLSEWLSTDALLFEVLFLDNGEANRLIQERNLLDMVLREPIKNNTVVLEKCDNLEHLAEHCGRLARRSLCHCLLVSADSPTEFRANDTTVSWLRVDAATPVLTLAGDTDEEPETDGPLEAWGAALQRLLQAWI
ncbi:MAG: hypothetical protein JNM56_03555 [Planctomycetia bacterium]|nr:hypothetical protein [Planctomycetia bacterium]